MKTPKLNISKVAIRDLINNELDKALNNLLIKDFELNNYNSFPSLKVEMLERDL